LPEFGEGNYLRPWFEVDLAHAILLEPLYSLCTEGKNPLEGTRDRFREWLYWAWVSERTKEKEKEKDQDKK